MSLVSLLVIKIGFEKSGYESSERAGSVQVCAKLLSGELRISASIEVSTADGDGMTLRLLLLQITKHF